MTASGRDRTVAALVLHARDVPSHEREAFAEAVAPLGTQPGALLVRTCHRVEIYLAGSAAVAPAAFPELPAGARRLFGEAAVRHLVEVAAGLDSVVVGEDELLHQLRTCLADRREAAPLDPALERLFQLALRVGRQARAWREGGTRSLADVALDRIERTRGPLAGETVLVVGAGRMGRLAALAAARRGSSVLVANRTADRAEILARDAGGRAVPLALDPALAAPAGVVVAIGAAWPVDPLAARGLVERGSVVVDLSSPPAVDPVLQARLGERFVSVDVLARGPEAAPGERLRRRLDGVIGAAVAEYANWLRTREAVPAIRAITERAEARRAAELERLLRRLPGLAAEERALVEQMSRRLVGGILHAPLAALREDESGERERAARRLFRL